MICWYSGILSAQWVSRYNDTAAKEAAQILHVTSFCLLSMLFPLVTREGRSNAHVKGDYQRIGDVMLRNMCALKVRSLV